MGHNITSERDNLLKSQQAQESFIKQTISKHIFSLNTQADSEWCNSLPELG